MSVFQAVVLGVIQGLSEFLPVSSSGHLIFLPKLFGWTDQGLAFDTVMHLGTLFAVIIYFRKKLWRIFLSLVSYKKMEVRDGNWKARDYRRLGFFLILSIIPAGVVGLFFNDWIETNLRSPQIIAFSLIFWGVILFVADNINKIKGWKIKSLQQINWKNSLFIGVTQAIALIPGTSRSGITMTAGLFSGLDKKSAAEFSFLMSVPIIALAGGSQLIEISTSGFNIAELGVIIAGFVSSGISGFIAIWGLMKIIQKWSFAPFVVYRVIVGILILIYLI